MHDVIQGQSWLPNSVAQTMQCMHYVPKRIG